MDILITYHSSHFPHPAPSRTFHVNDYNLEHQADVSYYLCIIGNSLRINKSIFNRIIGVPEVVDLVLREPSPLLFQEEIIKAYLFAKRAPPTLAQREYLFGQTLMLELFSSHHQWLYFAAPIWIESIEAFELELRESMLEDNSCRHVLGIMQTVTSRAESHFIWGYSTLESMILVREDKERMMYSQLSPCFPRCYGSYKASTPKIDQLKLF
jgi:hypothetical protein